jgi:hypothetical protein
MKRLLILASLALASCTTVPQIPAAPVEVADRTALDEQAALSVELAYQAAATAVLTANRAGIIPAAVKPRIAAADRKAYAAVGAVRSAYDAGNAASYATALPLARSAVTDLLAAIRS